MGLKEAKAKVPGNKMRQQFYRAKNQNLPLFRTSVAFFCGEKLFFY